MRERTKTQLKKQAQTTLNAKFGFTPKLSQIVLLEAYGDGTYILFEIAGKEKIEYRINTYKIYDSIWCGADVLEIIEK